MIGLKQLRGAEPPLFISYLNSTTKNKSTIYKVLYKVSLRERTVIINEEIHLDSLLTFFLIILMFLMSIHTN